MSSESQRCRAAPRAGERLAHRENKNETALQLWPAPPERTLYRLRLLRSPRLDQLDGGDCGWLKGLICYW